MGVLCEGLKLLCLHIVCRIAIALQSLRQLANVDTRVFTFVQPEVPHHFIYTVHPQVRVQWKMHAPGTSCTSIFRHKIVLSPPVMCRACGDAIKVRQSIGLASA